MSSSQMNSKFLISRTTEKMDLEKASYVFKICCFCQIDCQNAKNLYDHVTSQHKIMIGSQMQCVGNAILNEEQTCTKTFKTFDSFLTHFYSFHLGKEYVCDVCELVYKHPPSLSRHKKSQHPEIAEQKRKKKLHIFSCPICHAVYKTKLSFNMKRHVMTCQVNDEKKKNSANVPDQTERKRRVCSIYFCDRTFSNNSNMKKHQKEQHKIRQKEENKVNGNKNSMDSKNSEQKKNPEHFCQVCGEILHTYTNLYNHFRHKHVEKTILFIEQEQKKRMAK